MDSGLRGNQNFTACVQAIDGVRAATSSTSFRIDTGVARDVLADRHGLGRGVRRRRRRRRRGRGLVVVVALGQSLARGQLRRRGGREHDGRPRDVVPRGPGRLCPRGSRGGLFLYPSFSHESLLQALWCSPPLCGSSARPGQPGAASARQPGRVRVRAACDKQRAMGGAMLRSCMFYHLTRILEPNEVPCLI